MPRSSSNGLLLADQGENERALPLLRAAVAHEQAIEHAQAAEHAALLAQIAATAHLPSAETDLALTKMNAYT